MPAGSYDADVDPEAEFRLAAAEGIDLDISLAGIGSRGIALLVDMVLALIVLIVVGWALQTFGDIGQAGYAVLAFVVSIGYPILFEGFAGGRTPGKAAMGIQVVNADATRIGFLAAAIRGVVRPIDMLPGMYLVGVVSILATQRAQRLGDLAASTIVIHRPSERSRRRNEDLLGAGRALHLDPVLSPEAAGWDVTAVGADLVAMSRAFLARREQLDPQQRDELARTIALQLMPLIAGVPLDGGPEHLIERVVAAKTGG